MLIERQVQQSTGHRFFINCDILIKHEARNTVPRQLGSYYRGATLVNKNVPTSHEEWGFTLGPYINSKNMVADPYHDPVFRHEYGHTLQSQLVGPLYLTSVALPSLIGQGLDDIGLNNHNYEWYETQANRMSHRYFKNHDSKALVTLPWDDINYPRNYHLTWYWVFAHPPLPFMWWLFF